MVSTLFRQIKQYKKASLLTPLFTTLKVEGEMERPLAIP